MIVALIKDSVVQNVIIVESIDRMQEESPEFCALFDELVPGVSPGVPSIGWTWDGETFSPPAE